MTGRENSRNLFFFRVVVVVVVVVVVAAVVAASTDAIVLQKPSNIVPKSKDEKKFGKITKTVLTV